MALSQLQCLDENHVNPRTNESKPEFLYCEDQRLALETLLRDGREAFLKYLESRALRGFLSDPELETLCALAEPYEPDSELLAEKPEESDPPLSLHYWPDLSDTSIPEMDLGWPDSVAYRGVTRTTVYCQPPIDGQAHIKEVVRRMIAHAQKVMTTFQNIDLGFDPPRNLVHKCRKPFCFSVLAIVLFLQSVSLIQTHTFTFCIYIHKIIHLTSTVSE